MSGLRPLVAGNWKMNGLRASLPELAQVVAGSVRAACDVAVCPPMTLLAAAVDVASGSRVAIGAQDCAAAAFGAFTGDISPEMLADVGAKLVIVGHSERRVGHGETDAVVRGKAEAAARAGLVAIVCIGETGAERQAGNTNMVLQRQLEGSVPSGGAAASLAIAYEPVWAIGTGLTPTADEIAAAHTHIRSRLAARIGEAQAQATRILYGGSVKADNAKSIASIAGVDGALVGGASLKAAEFLAIVAAFS